MRYIVRRDYWRKNVRYQAGQIIEIDDPEYAAWLKRDMRGHLELILPEPPAPEPEPERAVEAPEHNRMMHKPVRKRSTRKTTKTTE